MYWRQGQKEKIERNLIMQNERGDNEITKREPQHLYEPLNRGA